MIRFTDRLDAGNERKKGTEDYNSLNNIMIGSYYGTKKNSLGKTHSQGLSSLGSYSMKSIFPRCLLTCGVVVMPIFPSWLSSQGIRITSYSSSYNNGVHELMRL